MYHRNPIDDSDHRSAKNRQLATLRHARNFQIRGKRRVPAHVSQHRQRPGRNHGASDRQAVEPIGQIHRITRAHDHERHKNHERQKRQRPQMRIPLQTLHHQIGMKLLEKRHDQLGRIHVEVCMAISIDAITMLVGDLQAQLGAPVSPRLRRCDTLV